jgi:nucleoside-diphosphate-sugar epimerase
MVIVGCGDIGKRVAALAAGNDVTISALIRSQEKVTALEQQGLKVVIANLDDSETLHGMPTRGATIFYFAPPPGGGIVETRARNFCAAIPPGEEPARVIYLSTTAVYGDTGGRPVTEETPPDPQTARGKRRLDGETAFREWGMERHVPVVILRVTGIYGPGRLPISQLASGQPVLNEAEAGLTNRIHADDLARVCLAAAEKGDDGDIFNVSDGHPGTLTEYFTAAADLLGLPRPRQVTMAEAQRVMSPLMLSYIQESRCVDNRKMLDKLGIELLYPDLRAGLPSCRPEAAQG